MEYALPHGVAQKKEEARIVVAGFGKAQIQRPQLGFAPQVDPRRVDDAAALGFRIALLHGTRFIRQPQAQVAAHTQWHSADNFFGAQAKIAHVGAHNLPCGQTRELIGSAQ